MVRFLWVGAGFGACTVVGVGGTLVEEKMRGFKGECAHFGFNECPICTRDCAGAEFGTQISSPQSEITLKKSVPY